MEGRVVNREVSLEHSHRLRVELLDPRHGDGLWLTQQELIQHFEFSRASFKQLLRRVGMTHARVCRFLGCLIAWG